MELLLQIKYDVNLAWSIKYEVLIVVRFPLLRMQTFAWTLDILKNQKVSLLLKH